MTEATIVVLAGDWGRGEATVKISKQGRGWLVLNKPYSSSKSIYELHRQVARMEFVAEDNRESVSEVVGWGLRGDAAVDASARLEELLSGIRVCQSVGFEAMAILLTDGRRVLAMATCSVCEKLRAAQAFREGLFGEKDSEGGV